MLQTTAGASNNLDADSEDDVEPLVAAYQDQALEPPHGIVVPDVFWYIHFKAFAFLWEGPEEYRKLDALHRPSAHLPATRLDAMWRGCEEILQFRGLSYDRPLRDIGIDGFYSIIRLFHFESGRQTALRSETPGVVVDEMQLTHIVDGRRLTLYNMVKPSGGKTESDRPCLYCGKPLRTGFAKQCRHCGMDWHDPSNIVCRKRSLNP